MSDSPQLSASLLRLKLLDALRNGDINKIDTIVDELTSCKPTLQTQEIVQLKKQYCIMLCKWHPWPLFNTL